MRLRRTARVAMGGIRDAVRTAMTAVQNQIVTKARDSRTAFAQNLQQLQTEARQSFGLVRTHAAEALSAVASVFRRHVQEVGQLWQTHLQGSDGIVANARTAFNALWSNVIKPTLDVIQAGWRLFGDDLVAIIRAAFDTVLTVVRIALDGLLTAINVTLDIISGDWEGAWTNLQAFFERTWTAIANWARTSGRTLIVSAMNIIVNGIKAVWREFYTWIIGGSFFPEMLADVADYVRGAGAALVAGAFDSLVGGIENALNSINTSGIENALSGIIDAANDAIDSIQAIPNSKTVDISVDRNYTEDYGMGRDDARYDDDDGGGGGGSFGGRGPGGADDSSNTGAGDGSGGFVGLSHGGIVDAPTSGQLFELHGREAVTPLDKLPALMADAMEQAGGGTTVVIEEGAIQAPGGDPDEILAALDEKLQRRLGR